MFGWKKPQDVITYDLVGWTVVSAAVDTHGKSVGMVMGKIIKGKLHHRIVWIDSKTGRKQDIKLSAEEPTLVSQVGAPG